ncbi:hypothetical protein NLX94_38620, partial [Streptomyces sp. TBY4]|nr:hypothetical protein [Streptomyces sp. TBY4]
DAIHSLLSNTEDDAEAQTSSLFAELDKLAASLHALPTSSPARVRLATRVKAILTGLDATPTDTTVTTQRIETATDDEMFAFIDRALGTR